MPKEIQIAICLVLIFEGLFLFAVPEAWQRMAAQLAQSPAKQIRFVGGVILIVGLIAFAAVRG